MSGGFTNPIIGGGGSLVYPSIHSPNFVSGTSGWSINKDGSAQFHDVALTGGSLVVTGAGEGVFLYSGSPAHGNLIASFASAAGTDAHGNAYIEGLGFYDASGPTIEVRPDLHALLVYQG